MNTGLEERMENPSLNEEQLNRRNFLRRAVAAIVAPTLACAAEKTDTKDSNNQSKQNPTYKISGRLRGKWLTGYYSWYTNIKGWAPTEVSVDFRKQLNNLWERKMKRTSNSVVRQAYNERVKEYLDPNFKPTTMSIEKYLGLTKAAMKEVNDNIEWNTVGEVKELNPRRQKLLEDISRSLTEKDLISYALTELMPKDDGKGRNPAVLDFLLTYAGMEYVHLIPALGDSLTSFGPYQWTSYAIYDAEEKRRGASIINLALPKEKRIPGSVIYLRENDQHKAAYLFAIGNLADIIKRLNETQLSVLENCWQNKKSDIVQYIATAHHCPGDALNIAKKWLDNKAKDSYHKSCYGRFKSYAERTIANIDALKDIETDSNIGALVAEIERKRLSRTEYKPEPSPEPNEPSQKQRIQKTITDAQKSFIYGGEYESQKGWKGAYFIYTLREGDIGSTPKETAINAATRFNREDDTAKDLYKKAGWGNVKIGGPEGEYVHRLPKNPGVGTELCVVVRKQ